MTGAKIASSADLEPCPWQIDCIAIIVRLGHSCSISLRASYAHQGNSLLLRCRTIAWCAERVTTLQRMGHQVKAQQDVMSATREKCPLPSRWSASIVQEDTFPVHENMSAERVPQENILIPHNLQVANSALPVDSQVHVLEKYVSLASRAKLRVPAV